jgi:hypothetical protein
LFTLEHLVEGQTIVNIKNLIMKAFIIYSGLIVDQIAQHVCIRVDGVSMFQG